MIFYKILRRNAIKLTGEKSSALGLARGRIVLISAFFVLCYIMLAARAVDLTVIQGSLTPKAQGTEITAVPEDDSSHVPRAKILDRNGTLLAATLQSASLYADPYLIADPVAAAEGLSRIFPGLSYGDLLQKLQGGKRFVWLARNVMPAEQQAVMNLGEPGLAFRYEDRRVYPQGPLAAHLIGYTDIDNQGLGGIERNFNMLLRRGQDLTLTLDVRLQHALKREVARAVSDFQAKAGVGIIMNANTGEVLAGVSLPDFDPHNAGSASGDQMFNRMTLGVYELGSVFKIFSTAAFLETHNVPMSTSFDAREPIRMGRFTINDYHAENRILTIPEVFMYSSNIGSAMMGQAVGTEGLRDFYEDLGLLSPLDFEIREITPPMVPSPWRDINTLTASYGHGLATTPLQVAAAVSSIVNGGYLVKPKLILDGGEAAVADQKLRVASSETSDRMRQLMRLVVSDGTGSKANVPGYNVGGKTGTAEKIAGRGYDRKRLISSFIGAFPMDAPEYVIFIAIDEPRGNKASYGYATGGWVAAPAFARVVTSMAAILNIPAQRGLAEHEISAPLKQFVSAQKHD